MKSHRKSGAVSLFIGALLIVIFGVGLTMARDPGAFTRRYYYSVALEHFTAFCAGVWLPAGIIGIPLFLISLITSLVRERKEKQQEKDKNIVIEPIEPTEPSADDMPPPPDLPENVRAAE